MEDESKHTTVTEEEELVAGLDLLGIRDTRHATRNTRSASRFLLRQRRVILYVTKRTCSEGFSCRKI